MTADNLIRIDAEKNMARFYKLDVQPTLFGEWAVIREWGRIGRGGTVRSYDNVEAAEAARDQQRQVKQRRGYQP
ncbi:WGR domain-containing protein [Bradyrhizobium septentrionale]|uniref:WGR domain-containing protein n=1 Tax=Bradyrhizobium septentrionale TaxID=1404411 RepID=A0A974A4A6_9BRAD|nr:WGR domain-containing protein [Bradyrhizobium septentrionale]UGY17951.1 WGR domain-containing protein [Bradyrhizobium septentrionale]